MSQAREILDQRLAKGEITEEEHGRLVAKLQPAGSGTSQPAYVAAPATPAAIRKPFPWGWVVPIAIGAVAMIALNNGKSTEDLTVGDVRSVGSTISFRVANANNTARDALFWIEQGDVEKCPVVAWLKAATAQTLSIKCPTIVTGDFHLRYIWASHDTGRRNISTRIESAT